MAQTLLLDQTTWDLVIDSSGNIAVASEPYALAQDAASAIKTFAGELWYDETSGIPYLTQVLGFAPSISLIKMLFIQAALTVPDIVVAQVFISGIAGRTISGQVQVTSNVGGFSAMNF